MTVSEQNDLAVGRLCENVERLRTGRGLTLGGLSEQTGVPRRILAEMAKGRLPRSFTVEMLLRLACFFQARPADLLEENPAANGGEK